MEYNSEADVDSEVDFKDNWEAKQEDLLESTDANNRLLDKDMYNKLILIYSNRII